MAVGSESLADVAGGSDCRVGWNEMMLPSAITPRSPKVISFPRKVIRDFAFCFPTWLPLEPADLIRERPYAQAYRLQGLFSQPMKGER